MPKTIYCVKLCQRQVQGNEELGTKTPYLYFPYDRFYLMKRNDLPLAQKMFRYFFMLPLDEDLRQAIKNVRVDKTRTISQLRNDNLFEYIVVSAGGYISWLTDLNEWMIVVPTHVRGRYKDREAINSFVGYVQSQAVFRNIDKEINMPQVTLFTPTREIGLFCAVCTNIMDYYEGKCRPGTQLCLKNVDTELPYDSYNARSEKQSSEEVGG